MLRKAIAKLQLYTQNVICQIIKILRIFTKFGESLHGNSFCTLRIILNKAFCISPPRYTDHRERKKRPAYVSIAEFYLALFLPVIESLSTGKKDFIFFTFDEICNVGNKNLWQGYRTLQMVGRKTDFIEIELIPSLQ